MYAIRSYYASAGHKFFSAEREAAVAAVAGDRGDRHLIDEHGWRTVGAIPSREGAPRNVVRGRSPGVTAGAARESLDGEDADEASQAAAIAKLDASRDARVERVVVAATDVAAGLDRVV